MDANKEPRPSQDDNSNDREVIIHQQSGASGPKSGDTTKKERNDSFNLDNQIKQFSLNFVSRQIERQFRSTADIASCISLIGLPITLLCSFLAYLNLYKK